MARAIETHTIRRSGNERAFLLGHDPRASEATTPKPKSLSSKRASGDTTYDEGKKNKTTKSDEG
jgi:hypothetical protein